MTNEEMRIAVAVELHGEDCEPEYINPASGMEPSGWRMSDANGDDTELPNYPEDWNQRPVMLTALTPDNIESFLKLAIGAIYSDKPNHQIFYLENYEAILNLDQPTFCCAWLKVRGNFKGDV